MQLIGMLDSPFVRRVAVALLKLQIPFQHKPISLFRHIDAFSAINPLLKAPTLVTDESVVLVDSTTILEFIHWRYEQAPSLWPVDPKLRLTAYRAMSVALTVGEKAVQLHYERALRPPERQHEPWRQRVLSQLTAGLEALEREPPFKTWFAGGDFGHPDIAVATMVGFGRLMFPDLVSKERYPRLAAFCDRAEALPEFRAAPAMDGATVGMS